ncbi:MAG TPA: cupredoxin domain-containing protein [Thermoanaerobaculia bacterium]|nr:cupredoxin domain-containing protein [Thermoanaerobaculia bacterium]
MRERTTNRVSFSRLAAVFAALAAAAAMTACAPAAEEDELVEERRLEQPAPPEAGPLTTAPGDVTDTDAQLEADGAEVHVGLSDYAIDMPATLPAGPTTFHVENQGTVEHGFEVEGEGIEEELASHLQPGESGELTVDLRPGTYEVYCPVEDHEERGMVTELVVEERAG